MSKFEESYSLNNYTSTGWALNSQKPGQLPIAKGKFKGRTFQEYTKTFHRGFGWKFKTGVKAFGATLAVGVVPVIFVKSIQNLWRQAITGKQIKKVKILDPKNPVSSKGTSTQSRNSNSFHSLLSGGKTSTSSASQSADSTSKPEPVKRSDIVCLGDISEAIITQLMDHLNEVSADTKGAKIVLHRYAGRFQPELVLKFLSDEHLDRPVLIIMRHQNLPEETLVDEVVVQKIKAHCTMYFWFNDFHKFHESTPAYSKFLNDISS